MQQFAKTSSESDELLVLIVFVSCFVVCLFMVRSTLLCFSHGMAEMLFDPPEAKVETGSTSFDHRKCFDRILKF